MKDLRSGIENGHAVIVIPWRPALAVLVLLAAIGIGMVVNFGQQIITVNERSALKRCWINQEALARAVKRLKKATELPDEKLELTADLLSLLVKRDFLYESIRDTEPDRRGDDGSWKYYQILPDGTVTCAYHGTPPKENPWALDARLPRTQRPPIDTPARKPLPPKLIEKIPFGDDDEKFAQRLQLLADELTELHHAAPPPKGDQE